MKLIAALLATVATAAQSSRAKYVEHMIKFGKVHQTVEEFEKRHELYLQTDTFIEEHNATNSSYTLGHNQFSDMTKEEMDDFIGVHLPPPDESMMESMKEVLMNELSTDGLPESVNWIDEDKVNPVRNQGYRCTASYAFAAIGAFESAYAIETG